MSLPDKLDEFKAGDTVYYFESGYIHKVEIIKVLSNEDWEAYRLRVVELLLPRGYESPFKEVFECSKRRGIKCLWEMFKSI